MIDTELLKRKILDLAIKGKLVPQDSTDEPASELLKRIKIERDRLIDEGKIKGKKDDFSYIFKGEDNCYYEKELGNLFIPVSTLDKEVKTKETLKVGNIPVISQSLSFIDGYTNSEEKSIKDVPLILFGDHTKIVKYIDFKFCPGADGTKLFKPLDNIYAKYFYYLALYASFNIENRGYGRHSALIKKQIVPVFKNREMQILITYFLDYIFYKIDCITELAKSIDKLKGIIKTKIISLGIQGKLLNSDDNYYYEKMLSDVAKITMGQSIKSEEMDTVDAHNSLEFHQGKTYFTQKTISNSNIYTKHAKKTAEPNSILFSVRAPVGAINYCDRQIAIGRGLAAITPRKDLSIDYLYYLLFDGSKKLIENSTGTTFDAIKKEQLYNLKVLIPQFQTQERIIAIINKCLDTLLIM